ncbi:hypothetical protein PMIN03_005394 [Paraphaeosphaeria minitans]
MFYVTIGTVPAIARCYSPSPRKESSQLQSLGTLPNNTHTELDRRLICKGFLVDRSPENVDYLGKNTQNSSWRKPSMVIGGHIASTAREYDVVGQPRLDHDGN